MRLGNGDSLGRGTVRTGGAGEGRLGKNDHLGEATGTLSTSTPTPGGASVLLEHPDRPVPLRWLKSLLQPSMPLPEAGPLPSGSSNRQTAGLAKGALGPREGAPSRSAPGKLGTLGGPRPSPGAAGWEATAPLAAATQGHASALHLAAAWAAGKAWACGVWNRAAARRLRPSLGEQRAGPGLPACPAAGHLHPDTPKRNLASEKTAPLRRKTREGPDLHGHGCFGSSPPTQADFPFLAGARLPPGPGCGHSRAGAACPRRDSSCEISC